MWTCVSLELGLELIDVRVLFFIWQVWLMKPRNILLNEWNQNSLDLILQGMNTQVHDLGDVDKLSPQHLRCSRRGAIPGQKSAIFSGLRSAVAFRLAAYKLAGIQPPEKPANRIIIFNRENAGRAFENIADMITILKKYKARLLVWGGWPVFLTEGLGVLIVRGCTWLLGFWIASPHHIVRVDTSEPEDRHFNH